MDKQKLIGLLQDQKNQEDVEKFAAYCEKLALATNNNKPKNPWMAKTNEQKLAILFKRVSNEGLVLNGDDVTLQGMWSNELGAYTVSVSYNYQAYKNKMLLAYPESKIDVALVYKEDTFEFEKESGQIGYVHKIANPFGQKDEDIIGGYCVIKNKRGEFLTTMSAEDLEKHRKVAKTDFIWKQWFKEMCLKTLIKKACSKHFKDTFINIEEMDNDQYELENPLDLKLKWKQEIDAINDMDKLREYYLANRGEIRGKEFDKYVMMRKTQLSTNKKQDENI